MTTFDTAFWITSASILALLVLSAFFSGSETALTASSRAKLRAQADKGSKGAETALNVTEDSERLIGSVLLGNNLVNILSASLATALFTRLFGDSGVAMATLIMTVLVLVFAEVLPKTYAITNPETAAARVAGPIRLIVLVFAPVVSAVRVLVRGILALVGVRTDPDSAVLSYHEEIAGTLALGHQEGTVDKEDRDRLLGALDLASRTVEEVMLHRSHLETVNIDAPVIEIIAQSVNSPHSRLPAWRDEPENIVGVIHSRDLMREVHRLVTEAGGHFGAVEKLDILSVARAPYFVPDTTPLDEQMQQFLQQRRHFALVIDEYGALLGLITLEDILEEIVGEIVDEHDLPTEDPITRLDSGAIEIDGAMTIRDLNRAMDWALPDDEANTVAGLVIHEAQAIPEAGQVFQFHGFRFAVVERQENRLTRLRIRRM
ncbi:MAG: HlyC/CorC family transporter [Rhodobacter sp.]|nr:HlyC/CorC family transporter [Paracoccaceae bacterium]MCC0079003.1 HlyC/CorC family transporter [Rhodobacter sp.]